MSTLFLFQFLYIKLSESWRQLDQAVEQAVEFAVIWHAM